MTTKTLSHKMQIKLKQIYSFIIKIFIFCLFLFARTFTGLTIYGYRLGEYIIGGALLLVFIYSILIPIFKKRYFLDSKSLNIFVVLLISSFVIRIALSDATYSEIIIFKTSLYIWSLGALVIGYYFLNDKIFELHNNDMYLAFFGLFVIYLFSTRGISDNLQNYFLQYSDKFEYPKGSDLLLAFIVVFFVFLNRKQFSKNSFIVFLWTGSLFAPLFMVKSRSGFISLIIFFLIAFSEFKKNIKKPDRALYISIFVSIIIFVLSSSWVVSKDIIIDEEIPYEIKYAVTSRYNTINDNPYEEKVLDLTLFYFRDGRIFSSDGNLNWRLQIWQDILSDMWNSNNILNGYGFQDIIPAMNSDQRLGQDGTNTNVHNYVMHIFSRGGLIHLTLCIMIFYQIFKMFKAKAISKDYQLIVVPLIFNSLFDPSMENAHYSIIMYLLIGLALNNRIILKEENLNL
jgi:hypothetical protein